MREFIPLHHVILLNALLRSYELNTPFHRGKIFVAKNASFLDKEFLSKEVSGRKVELDEVIVPAPELESNSSRKLVPVIPTPISEEVNDDDHETSDQVTTEPRR